ncbi:MAG: amidohydrolase family protein [Balneolaceae bacterium]
MIRKQNDSRTLAHRLRTICTAVAAWLLLPSLLLAQTVPTDGMKDNTPRIHAFTNATIITSPGTTIQNGTLVIRDGVIEAVGRRASIPDDARVWNMEGKTIYPGFIDAFSEAGMDDPREEIDRGPQSWSPHLRAHLSAADEFKDDDAVGALRSNGFTVANSVPTLGIFRGSSSAVSLSDSRVTDRIIRDNIAQSVTMNRGREFGFGYPTSTIGVYAFIRQGLYDADWHDRAHARYNSNPSGLERPEWNAPLAALRGVVRDGQPLFFITSNEEEILRALRIRDEFSVTPWIKGNGYEYRILDVLADAGTPIILPLTFPDKPEIDSPEDALNRSLAELRHYYLAPENPARLANAGVQFAITPHGLDNHRHFFDRLRQSVARGLNKERALAALTTDPASMLGIQRTHGSIEQGKAASFVVTDGDLFENGTKILDVWVDGGRHEINSEPVMDPRGTWTFAFADGSLSGEVSLTGTLSRLRGNVTIDGTKISLESATVLADAGRLRMAFSGDSLDVSGQIRMTASVQQNRLFGWAEIPGSDRAEWHGERTGDFEEEENNEPKEHRELNLADIRPAMEYGRESLPEQPRAVLVRNATIWTMGSQGVIENGDLLVRDGKVAEVGTNLSAPRNAVVIDAAGKHVTPGLIDAHLHSGTDGVNEVGNAITAEVRLGDVLNINNIWMYRQLAGGLTTAHVMHGSANPIGGQNAFVKMRWGALSGDLQLEGAPRTVKFALGENPKRVGSDRYPETRMGTHQIISDRFKNARDYEARWQAWERNNNGLPPRRDLRLDAIRDILNGDILVQSHSYRQDEILMLTRLAEEFGFSIKAFHHGVEAYKVAPELADSGVGAVVWSDWSSFKIEAYDGILHNAKLLHEAGVLTSLHSDNSQIASRMNWEAAKMVHVGVDPVDALAMVTINTAAVLGIDDKVGSLEQGKDADFVIWSGDPLSTFTKAEQTWVDGRKYFDLTEHGNLREEVEREREMIIQWILEEK